MPENRDPPLFKGEPPALIKNLRWIQLHWRSHWKLLLLAVCILLIYPPFDFYKPITITLNNDFKQIAELNRNIQDYPTLRVANSTLNPSKDHKTIAKMWGTKVRGDIGHIISLAIYYHNSSKVVAKNVQIRVNFEKCQQIARACTTLKAEITGSNFAPVYGEATIESPPNSGIVPTHIVMWRPNQTVIGIRTLPNGQTGEEIYTASGLTLGDIEPGWSNQGSVIGVILVGS